MIGSALSGGVAVLRQRNFRIFYIGYATSAFGTAMSAIAVAFGVLAVGGDAHDLGVVLAAGVIPQVALMMVGGVTADRLGRRPTMLVADAARFCSQGLFALLLLVGTPHIWLFVVLSAVRGTGEAFFNPGLRAMAVETTPAGLLSEANAMLGLAQSAAKVGGPALGGVLVAIMNPGLVIAIDAGTYAVSVCCLAAMRTSGATARPNTSFLHDMREGWREFRSRTWLTATTVQFMAINLLVWGPFLVLGPVLAHDRFGGSRSWGIVMACYGAGAIAGGLLTFGRRPRRPLVTATIGTFGYALPCASIALSAPVMVIATAALLAGVGSSVAAVFGDTVTQQQVPAAVLARVSTFQTFGSYSLGPVAFAMAGFLSPVLGAEAILLFGAACALLSACAVLSVHSVRSMPWTVSAGEGLADRGG